MVSACTTGTHNVGEAAEAMRRGDCIAVIPGSTESPLREVAHAAVLNANYIHARLKGAYQSAFDGRFMHECVFDATPQAKKGTKAMDIAKALLDYGYHAPTVYFPLIVKEAMGGKVEDGGGEHILGDGTFAGDRANQGRRLQEMGRRRSL